MTSYSEYITNLEEQHSLIPKNVLVRTYNYRDPQSPQTDKTVKTSDIPEGVTTGQHYHYANHYLTAGIFTVKRRKPPHFTLVCVMNAC
ncbi:hypothetical protein ACVXG7_20510 [Enterobacter hormaechei]